MSSDSLTNASSNLPPKSQVQQKRVISKEEIKKKPQKKLDDYSELLTETERASEQKKFS